MIMTTPLLFPFPARVRIRPSLISGNPYQQLLIWPIGSGDRFSTFSRANGVMRRHLHSG